MSKARRNRSARAAPAPVPRRPRRRLVAVAVGLLLLLSGYGLGTASTAAIGLATMLERGPDGTGGGDAQRQAMLDQLTGGGAAGGGQGAEQQLMQQLMGGGGTASRGTLGILVVDDPEAPGATVATVSPGGPADVAGLRTGDVIVRADDYEIASAAALTELVSQAEPSAWIAMTVHRPDGTTAEVGLSVGADL